MPEILDQYLQRQMQLQRYALGVANRGVAALTEEDRELIDYITRFFDTASPAELASFSKNRRTGRVGRFYSILIQRLTAQQQKIVDMVLAEILGLAETEIDFAFGAVGSYQQSKPSAKEAAALPIIGYAAGTLAVVALTRYANSLLSTLRQSARNDESPTRIIRGDADQQYRNGLIHKRNNGVARDLRTVVAGVSANSRDSAHKAISQVDLEVWMSTLDGRTTKICASRDGDVFPVGSGPFPPAHYMCRSLRMPYFDDMEALRPYVRSFKSINDLSKADRKRLYDSGGVGQVDWRLNYQDWFGAQSAEFQKEWLGPARYEFFKAGTFDVKDFADPLTGKQYTIDELRSFI